MTTNCLNARNIFGGISVTGMAVSIANLAVGVYQKNPGEVVLSAISTIFFAALTGSSFKFIPEGAFDKQVAVLTNTTNALTNALGGANAANQTLDQLLTKLNAVDLANDREAEALKAILLQVKANLDQLSAEKNQLTGLYTQYKGLIDAFMPLLNQVGSEDADFASTVEKVEIQIQTVQSIDIELGQKATALQTFTAQLPALITKGKAMLVEQGKQIAQLTQEVAALKSNTTDMAAQVKQNQQLLQKIEAERAQLAKETAALQKLLPQQQPSRGFYLPSFNVNRV